MIQGLRRTIMLDNGNGSFERKYTNVLGLNLMKNKVKKHLYTVMFGLSLYLAPNMVAGQNLHSSIHEEDYMQMTSEQFSFFLKNNLEKNISIMEGKFGISYAYTDSLMPNLPKVSVKVERINISVSEHSRKKEHIKLDTRQKEKIRPIIQASYTFPYEGKTLLVKEFYSNSFVPLAKRIISREGFKEEIVSMNVFSVNPSGEDKELLVKLLPLNNNQLKDFLEKTTERNITKKKVLEKWDEDIYGRPKHNKEQRFDIYMVDSRLRN